MPAPLAIRPSRALAVARRACAMVAAAVLANIVVAGQVRAQSGDVPERYRPPPGMCRVWIENVPAARQPAPTDCPTAIRNRPANARVIFGEQATPALAPRRLRDGKDEKRDAGRERPDTAKSTRTKPSESAERAVIDEARKLLEKRRKP